MPEIEKTPRTTVRRSANRGSYDREQIHAIIDAAPICNVAITMGDGAPVIIPMLHARIDSTLYLHGSQGSRLMKAIGGGTPTCVAFTLLDGLVLARSALHHSMNYRSVVLFGVGRVVERGAEKDAAFEALVEQVLPGRWTTSRQPNEQEDKATAIVALSIDEASAKVRTGPPIDDESDLDGPYWAGVVPLVTRALAPITADEQVGKIPVPESVTRYVNALNGTG